jgi:2-polyprenyl-3-methyl-5-hydroxy-6-metoxy-1,4-benzoquinol methylase
LSGIAESAPSWAADELEAVPRCPICGSAERTTLYHALEDRVCGTRGRWTLKRCRECGSGYLDPRPTPATIGRAYERYYTHGSMPTPSRIQRGALRLWHLLRNGYLNANLGYRLRPASGLGPVALAPFSTWRRHARRLVSDLRHPGDGGRLLDVGCGNGRLLATMRWAGWTVEGVEPDARAAAAAKAQGLTVHVGTLDDVDLPDAVFDAVTLDNVLEHLPTPVRTLERCRQLLRPEGLLWIVTPNLDAPGHAAYGEDWLGLDAPRHLVLATAAGLTQALDEASFEAELLRPPRAGWMLLESEALRRGRRPARTELIKVALAARRENLRAARDATAGEELVVLARARPA